jgi:hypothetical protein
MTESQRVQSPTRHGKTVNVEPLEGRMLLNGSTELVSADFNGDNKADVASLGKGNGKKDGGLTVRLSQGDGTFKKPVNVNVNVAKGAILLAGDFNDDGKQDLAIAGEDKGKTRVTVLTGNGAGGLTPTATQTIQGILPLRNLTAADVNGDGAADLVSFSNTTVYAALNSGTGTFLPAVRQANPLLGGAPAAIGDIDNDGRADLIGVNGDAILANRWFIGQSEFLQNVPVKLTSGAPLAGRRIVLADVSGDGRNDLLAIGENSVRVALQITPPGQDPTFGAWVTTQADLGNSARVLVGDVNGDGKADLVRADDRKDVTRAKLVLISNGDGTFHKLVTDDDDDDDDDNGNGHGHGHGKGHEKGRGKGHDHHDHD